MFTDEELELLEESEYEYTEEAIATMILIINSLKSDVEKELRNFYQKYGTDGVITYSEARKWVSAKDRRRRILVLLALIGSRFEHAKNSFKSVFRSTLEDIVIKEKQFFDVDIDDIEDVINHKWGADELNWISRVDNDFESYEARILAEIRRRMIQQDDVDDVVDVMNDILDQLQRRERGLLITESTAVNSFARQTIMRELGASKYRFYAREDERTCEYCGSLHGKVFPISQFEIGVTASPIHPHCRCWEVPIIE